MSLASHPANESTISLENHDDDNIGQSYGNDFETNRRYLTFSWWLLHRGWKEIMKKVEIAVTKSFGPLDPREDITLERLSELTLEVRKEIEGATEEERRYTTIHLFQTKPYSQTAEQASGSPTSSQRAKTKNSSYKNPACPPPHHIPPLPTTKPPPPHPTTQPPHPSAASSTKPPT